MIATICMRGYDTRPDSSPSCGSVGGGRPTSACGRGTITGMHPIAVLDELVAAAVIDLLEERAVCAACRVDLGPLAAAGLVIDNTAWHTFATSLLPATATLDQEPSGATHVGDDLS